MSCLTRELCLVLICGSLCCGCGLIQTTKDMTRESTKMFRPKSNDYRNPTSESTDEWSELGASARVMRPTERANDPLRKYLLSPKAQSIERNLGVE